MGGWDLLTYLFMNHWKEPRGREGAREEGMEGEGERERENENTEKGRCTF